MTFCCDLLVASGRAEWRLPQVSLGILPAYDGAVRLAKESLVRGLDFPNLSDASLVDLYHFAALEQTEDKAEGHRAWCEKRKPAFRGG